MPENATSPSDSGLDHVSPPTAFAPGLPVLGSAANFSRAPPNNPRYDDESHESFFQLDPYDPHALCWCFGGEQQELPEVEYANFPNHANEIESEHEMVDTAVLVDADAYKIKEIVSFAPR